VLDDVADLAVGLEEVAELPGADRARLDLRLDPVTAERRGVPAADDELVGGAGGAPGLNGRRAGRGQLLRLDRSPGAAVRVEDEGPALVRLAVVVPERADDDIGAFSFPEGWIRF